MGDRIPPELRVQREVAIMVAGYQDAMEAGAGEFRHEVFPDGRNKRACARIFLPLPRAGNVSAEDQEHNGRCQWHTGRHGLHEGCCFFLKFRLGGKMQIGQVDNDRLHTSYKLKSKCMHLPAKMQPFFPPNRQTIGAPSSRRYPKKSARPAPGSNTAHKIRPTYTGGKYSPRKPLARGTRAPARSR